MVPRLSFILTTNASKLFRSFFQIVPRVKTKQKKKRRNKRKERKERKTFHAQLVINRKEEYINRTGDEYAGIPRANCKFFYSREPTQLALLANGDTPLNTGGKLPRKKGEFPP